MDVNKQRQIAYVVLAAALLVGVVGMVAFAEKTPDQPVRILFQTTAGRVIFDHATHDSDTGYGIGCEECHHAAQVASDPVNTEEACAACHDFGDDTFNMENFNHIQHYAEYTQDCLECHGKKDFDPKLAGGCTQCHKPGEAVFARKAGDAFHAQCIGCHTEKGAGPGEGPDGCKLCHIM